MRPSSRTFVRRRSGGYDVRLGEDERALIATLPGQLMALLSGAGSTPSDRLHPALRRLLPPAHTSDAEAERVYVTLQREDIAAHHNEALSTLAATASATHLEVDELASWLVAVNDLRLALGSMLQVTEESAEPLGGDGDGDGDGEVEGNEEPYSHAAEWAVYHFLGALQSEAVEALADTLPPPLPGADDMVPDDPWGAPPGDLRWDGTPRPAE